MNKKNEIKIDDFGISKQLNSTMYASTTNIGTIYYIAPEIVTKKNMIGTAFLTYYKEDGAKKCFDENKDKKILECDIEVQYRKNTNHYIHNNNYNNNYGNYNNRNLKINRTNLPENYNETEISKLCIEFGSLKCAVLKQMNKMENLILLNFRKNLMRKML